MTNLPQPFPGMLFQPRPWVPHLRRSFIAPKVGNLEPRPASSSQRCNHE